VDLDPGGPKHVDPDSDPQHWYAQYKTVFWIRILTNWIRILPSTSKKIKKNLDFYSFLTA
jgi:hypothetical protein